jgi:phage tail-like protein
MAEFVANTKRLDPYKNFKFQVKFGSEYVAGINKVSALKRTTEVIKHRHGGSPNTPFLAPGRTEFAPITMEHGLTQSHVFEAWAAKVWQIRAGLGGEVSLADFRKELTLEHLNEAGQTVYRYYIYNAWVSEYQAMPDLDANQNAVAIEYLKIEYEGFDRDPSLSESPEPIFTSTHA